MATNSEFDKAISDIESAVYGEEVRGAIVTGLRASKDIADQANSKAQGMDSLAQRIGVTETDITALKTIMPQIKTIYRRCRLIIPKTNRIYPHCRPVFPVTHRT